MMFGKEARKWVKENTKIDYKASYGEFPIEPSAIKSFKAGAEFGYNKANEWHKVLDKLPEMDELVYVWNKIDDFPVVARRHIPYGHKEWVWDCKWGSGYTVSQLVGENYLWKEIALPKLKEGE